MTKLASTSRVVTQSPEANSSKWSVRTSITRAVQPLRGPRASVCVGGELPLARVLPEPLVVGLLPAAARLVLVEHAVEELRELRVVLLEAAAVRLDGQLVADELERVVLDDHAGEDHVVGRDRVDGTVLQQLQALRVGVDEPQVRLRRLLLERLLVGRAERRADLLAGEVLDAGDVRALRHEDPSVRDEVRVREADLPARSSLIVIVERTRSTVPSWMNGMRLSEIASTSFGSTPSLSATALPKSTSKPSTVAAVRVLEAERRDVVLDADGDLALRLDLAHRRVGRELLGRGRRLLLRAPPPDGSSSSSPQPRPPARARGRPAPAPAGASDPASSCPSS